jgi:translation initiation factor 1A
VILSEYLFQSKLPFAQFVTGKGGKNNKKVKKRDEGETRRELIFKEDGQEYGQVQKMLGDGRAALTCYDGVARTGLIRGRMRRRVWINTVQ